MKKTYLIILLVLVVALAVLLLQSRTATKDVSQQNPIPTPTPIPTLTGTSAVSSVPNGSLQVMPSIEAPSPSPSLIEPNSQTVITYTENGYSPSSITIKNGSTVVFKNESKIKTWPASAVHPSHNEYPVLGGCIGSAFDACKGINPGDSWSFKFDVVGNWKYHDHLSPFHFGSISVE